MRSTLFEGMINWRTVLVADTFEVSVTTLLVLVVMPDF